MIKIQNGCIPTIRALQETESYEKKRQKIKSFVRVSLGFNKSRTIQQKYYSTFKVFPVMASTLEFLCLKKFLTTIMAFG
jgi:hypothetical protein